MGGRPYIDLTGKRIGKLTGVDIAYKNKIGVEYWNCVCECGNKKTIKKHHLTREAIKSCGCLRQEKHPKKHGKTGTRLHRIWRGMLSRCYSFDPRNRYKGRGITVCEEWQEFEPFFTWSMSNGYKDNLSIDRIDNNKGYYPLNCRWADDITQSNNRSDNHKIEINGEYKTFAEWSRITGLGQGTLRYRFINGYRGQELTQPLIRSKKYYGRKFS